MAARNYSNIAVATTLSSGIGSGDTSLTVVSATGWPSSPFLLVIEPDTANEELILVGSKAGAVFSSLTRGFGGTSGVAHNAAVEIKHVTTAEDHSLTWTHVHSGSGGDDTAQMVHDDLLSVGVDDHHAQAHAIDGGDHSGSLAHSALSGIGVDDHHNEAHDIDGVEHTASGLTAGHVVRASGATAFAFAQLSHSDLATVTANQHHNEDHQARHIAGGGDEISPDDFGSGAAADGQVLMADGIGGAAWEGIPGGITDHGALTGLTPDDDHPHYMPTNASRDFSGHVLPSSDNALDLGNSTDSWRRLYVHDIYNESGVQLIDGSDLQLVGSWEAGGHFLPNSDNAYDLGNATQSWRRLYSHDIYDEAGADRIDLNLRTLVGGAWLVDTGAMQVPNGTAPNPSMSFHQDGNLGWYRYGADQMGLSLAGSKRFHFAVGGNGSRIYGSESNDWIEIDGINEWIQFGIQDIEVVRFEDDGATPAIRLPGTSGQNHIVWSNNPYTNGVGDFTAFWDNDIDGTNVGWAITTTQASSRSLKRKIKDYPVDDVGAAFLKIPMRSWEYNATALKELYGNEKFDGKVPKDNDGNTRHWYVAEEVQEHLPWLVGQPKGDALRVKDGRPLMVAIISTLHHLNSRISELEAA